VIVLIVGAGVAGIAAAAAAIVHVFAEFDEHLLPLDDDGVNDWRRDLGGYHHVDLPSDYFDIDDTVFDHPHLTGVMSGR
jgi:cation diffusion facilitator CzcD-associated flavoprotein CzcO